VAPIAVAGGSETVEALVSFLTRAPPRGVSDGARTRDTQDHNLVLYQLSYTHHGPTGEGRRKGNGANDTGGAQASDAAGGAVSPSASSSAASSAANEPMTSSAAPFACSPLGPGAGTNTVRR
jgi:hypothetical protein